MKRIVAFISPVDADDYQQENGQQENGVATEEQPTRQISASQQYESHLAKEGMLKFEAIVSDAQLKPIVDALLLTQESDRVAESLIYELLQLELQLDHEDSIGLFNTILSNVERELLIQTYEECNKVKIKTAAKLGIDRNTLHKKLQKHGLIDYENG